MSNLIQLILGMLFVILIFFIVVCIGTWLWNWLVPMIFGLKVLTVKEFFGLMVLLAILLPGNYIPNK